MRLEAIVDVQVTTEVKMRGVVVALCDRGCCATIRFGKVKQTIGMDRVTEIKREEQGDDDDTGRT